jgi:hypothetical protein
MVKVIIGSGNVAQHLMLLSKLKIQEDEIEWLVFSRKAKANTGGGSVDADLVTNGFSCFIRRRFIHACLR